MRSPFQLRSLRTQQQLARLLRGRGAAGPLRDPLHIHPDRRPTLDKLLDAGRAASLLGELAGEWGEHLDRVFGGAGGAEHPWRQAGRDQVSEAGKRRRGVHG